MLRPPMTRPCHCIVTSSRLVPRLALSLVMFAFIAAAFSVAVASASSAPRTGRYTGHSSTNVKGNSPLEFSMTVTNDLCASPGATKRHRASCVTVDALSLVQSPCTDGFVADEFFPATEPIALRAGKIAHRYTLYSSGGQTYDRKIAGGTKFGSFQFSLTVTTHGTAFGSMHYSAQTASGSCDSGTVRISAKRKK